MIINELLRKKILDSAIRGSLIENDVTLEPISVDSIKENTPFELPLNWKWCYIKSIATCKTGNSINETEKREKYSDIYCDGLFYIATKDIGQNNNINYMNGIKIPNDLLNKFKIAKRDSALICIEGGSAGRKVGFTNQEVCYVNKLCNIYSEEVNNKYIYYFLQSSFFISEFDFKKTGIIGGVSVKNLEKLLIPIPPLSEQEKIVNRIDELLELYEKKQKNDEKKEFLKELLKEKIINSAIRGNLVENDISLKAIDYSNSISNIPFAIPNNWRWTTIQEISYSVYDGSHNPPKDSGIGIPILSALNIHDNKININEANRFVTLEDYSKENKKIDYQQGDVLLTIVGTVGRTAIIDFDDKFCLQRSVSIIKPKEFIYSKYLMYFLESKYCLDIYKEEAKGTAQAGFYLKKLKELNVSVPPLEEQKRIVEKIESLFELIEQL